MVDSELLEYVARLPGMPNLTREMKGSKMRTNRGLSGGERGPAGAGSLCIPDTDVSVEGDPILRILFGMEEEGTFWDKLDGAVTDWLLAIDCAAPASEATIEASVDGTVD